MAITLNVNKQSHAVDVPPDMPLLWVLRDVLGLKGKKYGCGIAQCGACTVHVDGRPVRSCVAPVRSVEDGKITTIEGLADTETHPVQQAWDEIDVPQCGYCQPGQIMSAAALLAGKPNSVDSQNRITVHQIWAAGDMGSQVINPRAAENLTFGGIIDGLSYAGKRPGGVELPSAALVARAPSAQDRSEIPQDGVFAHRAWRTHAAAGNPGRCQRCFRRNRQANPHPAPQTQRILICLNTFV